MTAACKIEAMRLKNKSRGKSSFSFLQGVLDLQSRSKMLIKKIMNNIVVQECFEGLMVSSDIISLEELKACPFIADVILANIFD